MSNTNSEHDNGTSPLSHLRALLGGLAVPSHRHSIWYYFGWLTLFLLMVTAGTGILLAVYYVPGAAPATSVDGRPLAAAVVTKDVGVDEHHYSAGDIIPLPYSVSGDSIEVPSGLRGAVRMLRDSAMGRPVHPSAAWVSVEQTIAREADFGWLVRSVHRYSAGMLMASIFIHLVSAFLMRAYRRPRELMWITGIILLVLMFSFGFTGSILPWNRLSYVATRIGVSYPEESLPLIGPIIADLIRGGNDVGAATLTRLYATHVVVLPVVTLALVGLHLLILHLIGHRRLDAPETSGGIVIAASLGIGALVALIVYPVIAGEFDAASPYTVLPLVILPVAVAYLLAAMAAGMPNAMGHDVPFYRRAIFRD